MLKNLGVFVEQTGIPLRDLQEEAIYAARGEAIARVEAGINKILRDFEDRGLIPKGTISN